MIKKATEEGEIGRNWLAGSMLSYILKDMTYYLNTSYFLLLNSKFGHSKFLTNLKRTNTILKSL